MALTKKRKRFVHEYLIDFNATQAAIRAGYSERSARGTAHRLLTNDDIQAYVKTALKESAMSAEECLKRLGEQARSDIADFVYVQGGLVFVKDLEALREAGLSHLVKEIRHTKDGAVIKLHDQQKALELIGKHHALFTDRIEGKLELGIEKIVIELKPDGSAESS